MRGVCPTQIKKLSKADLENLAASLVTHIASANGALRGMAETVAETEQVRASVGPAVALRRFSFLSHRFFVVVAIPRRTII